MLSVEFILQSASIPYIRKPDQIQLHFNNSQGTWADPEGGGGQGVRTPPPPPGIARLLFFAMLKFSARPLQGIWTLPSPPPGKFSGSAHEVDTRRGRNVT